MSTATATNKDNALALVKKDVVDVVGKKVQEFVSRGELRLDLMPEYEKMKKMTVKERLEYVTSEMI